MNELTVSLTQHRQEQVSVYVCVCWILCHIEHPGYLSHQACVLQRWSHVQRVVRRCAMRWKEQTFSKPRPDRAVKGKPPKRSVTFSLSSPGPDNVSSSDSVEQDAEDGALSKLWVWTPAQLWISSLCCTWTQAYRVYFLAVWVFPPVCPVASRVAVESCLSLKWRFHVKGRACVLYWLQSSVLFCLLMLILFLLFSFV